MPILTGPDLATALGLVTDSKQLAGIAASVSASVCAYLRFDPSRVQGTPRTEFFDTSGTQLLALNHGPVLAIASVNELSNWTWTDGAYAQGTDPFTSDTLLTAGTDYAWRTDAGSAGPVLVRLNALWPVSSIRPPNRLAGGLSPAFGTVKVVYTVDDSGILAVSQVAAQLEGVALYRSGRFGIGTVQSAGMDGASVSITVQQRRGNDASDSFVSPLVAPMLKPFRRTLIGG